MKTYTRNESIKTFPEFSRLTFATRKEFEEYTASFPPIADLTFAAIKMWWDHMDTASVSLLNDNLVISYWFPGDEAKSGLCLVGTNQVDESLCAIFDYQKERGEKPRVLHVPELVVEHIAHLELFNFKGERSYDEYIIPVDKHYPLKNIPAYPRMRIRKFLKRIDRERCVLRSVDLDDPAMRELLKSSEKLWRKSGTINLIYKTEEEALVYAIDNASLIDMDNLCLFIDGQLEGFCLFQRVKDKRYIIMHHARVGLTYPKTYDYMVYAVAEWFNAHGIQFANVEMDLGLPILRIAKLAMRPSNYFRKYTITPST